MSRLNIKGKIHSKSKLESIKIGEDSVNKASFILEVEEAGLDKPNYPKFEVWGKGAEVLDRSIMEGQPVEVDYYIKGRLYNRKTTGEVDSFVTLKAVSITPLPPEAEEQPAAPSAEPPAAPEKEGELPF